jgi:mono/diheme cytochrome c family protein
LTEIPEHLLKRSRERRAALGLGGDAPASDEGASSAAPVPAAAAATPASPAAASPAPVEEAKVAPPAPPPPDPPYIAAAKRRKRIPYWAMPVLAALPLWGYIYVRSLEPPPPGADDPQVLGATIYTTNCASCHGATGGGISAPGFVNGAVLKTWPDWRDHAAWVRLGTANWPSATYGTQKKPKAGLGQMPSWGSLTDQQIADVVIHERQLSGADMDPTKKENVDIYAVASGEKTLAQAGLGPLSKAAGVTVDDLKPGG